MCKFGSELWESHDRTLTCDALCSIVLANCCRLDEQNIEFESMAAVYCIRILASASFFGKLACMLHLSHMLHLCHELKLLEGLGSSWFYLYLIARSRVKFTLCQRSLRTEADRHLKLLS